jgi:hypothetical protein
MLSVATRQTGNRGGNSGFIQTPANLSRMGMGQGIQIDSTTDAPLWAFENAGNFMPQSFDEARYDNDQSIFGAQRLTYVLQKVVERPMPPLQAANMFPINREAGWNEFVEHYYMSGAGKAAMVCCAGDFPRVQLQGKSFKTPSITIGSGYEFCFDTQQKANLVGINLEAQLMRLAFRALLEAMNRYAFEGDSTAGILGIKNNPMIGAVMNPINLKWDDVAIDPVIIISVIRNLLTLQQEASNDAYPAADTLALPSSVYNALANRPVSGLNVLSTVLSVLQASGELKRIIKVPELRAMAPDGGRMAFLYNSDQDNVEWHLPISVPMVLPPFWNGYGYEVNVIARVNSLWFNHAQTALKVFNI